MSDVPELWYPIPSQAAESVDDSGADTASDKPPPVQLSQSKRSKEFNEDDGQEGFGASDMRELSGYLRDRSDAEYEAQQLAAQASLSNEFDNAIISVFSGAEATSAARQAFARFNPRDNDPQAFEFRNYVSTEFEKFGYF